jgi:hypothetical protein
MQVSESDSCSKKSTNWRHCKRLFGNCTILAAGGDTVLCCKFDIHFDSISRHVDVDSEWLINKVEVHDVSIENRVEKVDSGKRIAALLAAMIRSTRVQICRE